MDLDQLIAKLQEIRAEHGNAPEVIVEIRDVQQKVYDVTWDRDVTPFVFLETE